MQSVGDVVSGLSSASLSLCDSVSPSFVSTEKKKNFSLGKGN